MRRSSSVVMVLGLLLAAPGIGATTGTGPAGAAGERYLDEVFASVDVTSDIWYRSTVDHEGNPIDLHLDLYEPAGDTETERPLFIWIHGGSFAYGDKTDAMDVDVATRLAKHGYVVASINYRLRPLPVCSCNFLDNPEAIGAIGHAYMDGRESVNFLRTNAAAYGIDPDRIIIGGASAGGVTALNVAYWPQRWKGQGTESDPYHVDAVVSIAGMTLPGYLEPGEPPLFMAHGTLDTTVPYSGAVDVCDAAIAKGIHCELESYPAHHSDLVAFLDEIVDGGTADLYETTLFPRPSISGTAPGAGPGAGGTVVNLTGDHFTGATAVRFGGAPATSFTVVDDEHLTAVSPPSATGLYNVFVETPNGISATSTKTWFFYNTPGPPVVTSPSPRTGPAGGGNTVTVLGRGFTGATGVVFGPTPAASFTVVNDGKITAVAPASPAGLVNVVVTTPLGVSPSGIAAWYRFT